MILVRAAADGDGAVRALEAGARGSCWSPPPSDLIKAIRMVHEGQIRASKTVMPRIVEAFATLSRETELMESSSHRLSSREQAIVRQSALSNHEIAERLNLSEATVKAALTHIFGKPPS